MAFQLDAYRHFVDRIIPAFTAAGGGLLCQGGFPCQGRLPCPCVGVSLSRGFTCLANRGGLLCTREGLLARENLPCQVCLPCQGGLYLPR